MHLPQEVIDEVIDNLAFDFETLRSTSLVRKSWTHRSRRRLFYFVPINSLSRLEKWSLSISSNPNGIASYPRVVLLSLETLKSWVEPVNLDKFYDHFRSFSAVERLVISGLETTKFDAVSTPRYFGNFAATVRSLELRTAIGSPAALLSFVCSFPLVDDLAIEFPACVSAGGGNEEEVVQVADGPSFRGKLRLLDMFHESYPLMELLCTLPLPFHTICVSSRDSGRLPQLAKLTSKCGKTLRSLHITKKTHGTHGLRTIIDILLEPETCDSSDLVGADRRFSRIMRSPRRTSNHSYLPKAPRYHSWRDPPYACQNGEPLTNYPRCGWECIGGRCEQGDVEELGRNNV